VTAPVLPEAAATRASRRTRLFGISLVATVLVTALQLPWRLSGLGFGAIALYSGIRLLVDLARLRRAGRPAGGWVGVCVGLAVTTFMMLMLAGQLALYPLFAEQERCTARAITHIDAEQCRTAFEQRQADLLRRLQGG
jgi:hypothetical protein